MSVWMLKREREWWGQWTGGGGGRRFDECVYVCVCVCVCDQEERLAGIDVSCRD